MNLVIVHFGIENLSVTEKKVNLLKLEYNLYAVTQEL